MLQAVASPGVGVSLVDVPVPVPGRGCVLVRSRLVGICGSDTHALAGHHPFLTAPYVPGHEATGEVVDVGADVGLVRPGQRVLLKPNVECGKCVNCLAGRTNACETLSWIGCDVSGKRPGAMAEFFVSPESNLVPVPDSMDDRDAVLVECLATPVHAARIAGDLTGARVVVLGAGTIGGLCVVAALHAGAEAVVVTDLEEAKIARAVRIGARGGTVADGEDVDRRVRTLLDGPADVVFDCVASQRSLEQAVTVLRRAGTLLVVGVPAKSAPVALPQIQDWELRVQGCAAYTGEDILAALRIASDGGLPAGELTTATYSLHDVAEAFARASQDTAGKVFVSPPSVG